MSLNHTSSISGAPAAAHPSGIPHSPTVPGVPGAPLSFGERARQFHRRVFVDYWPYWAACLAAAVLNIVLLAYWGSAWGVTGELTRWGGHIVTALGIDAKSWPYFQEIGLEGSPLQRTSGYLTIGMLGGALVGALVSGNFRHPPCPAAAPPGPGLCRRAAFGLRRPPRHGLQPRFVL